MLAGGGEMGALMRSIDWSCTPVGPVSSWPQSLRTAVSIMLAAKFPMYIAWGREFTQMYNDEYRPILGATKHPAAMGSSTLETFAEIWNIIGPMFEGVMRGEAVGVYDFLLPMDRFGFIEECRFTFSYSPVRQEDGTVGGVLVTVSETTARVLSERRMAVLRDIAAETAEAGTVEHACAMTADAIASDPADIPFALLYLLDATGRHARLVASTDATGSAPAPAEIDLEHGETVWPLRASAARREPLVASGLGRVTRPYLDIIGSAVIEQAMVLPIERPNEAKLAGFLIAGISPRLRLDQQYRDFLGLVAHQVGAALEQVRAMEEAKARAEALAEIDRAKTIFFSNVSHEFRTPLTLMLAPLDDLVGDPGIDAPFREQIDVVRRNALRLLKLVNSLLEFSRIEAGRVDAVYEATDLAATTADLASVFRSAAQRAGIELRVDCPPLGEPVFVDRDMWEKIVLNLVSNAVKFTFEGEIEVSIRREGDHAVLRVRDTGEGIPENELPKLFTRFHTVRGQRSRTYEGTGIGLALVQELVRLHGGSVAAESSAGEGTEFTIRIPFGSGHLPQDRLDTQRIRPATSIRSDAFALEAMQWLPRESVADDLPRSMPGGRLLVADDNADMRDYLRRLLGTHWDVDTVADGQELVAAARSHPPDVILADVMMPGLDGFEAIRALRAEEATRQIPIILLSARAGEEARVEGLDAGAHDYLVKPFSPRELIARVRAQIEQAHARAAELEHARRLQILTRAAVTINSELSLAEIFTAITGTAREVVNAHQAIAALHVGEEPLEPITTFSFSERHAEWQSVGRYPIDFAPVIADLHAPTRLSDEEIAERPVWRQLAAGGPALRGLLATPLTGRDGATIGLILVSEKDEGVFNAEDEALLVQLAQLASVAIENARLYAELQRANYAKDEFLAMLSHELRTPMTATLGWASMLSSPSGLSEETRQLAVQTIEQSTRAQAKLIEDILDVSRISTGKLQLKEEPVDLCALVASACETVRPAAAAKRIELTVSLGEIDGRVIGDPARLQQIVWNLLQNAIKFTPSDGHVVVSVSGSDGMATLAVTDDGEGIDPAFLPHVFDRFSQADSGARRQFGGLGLGLAIVKSLVERHGGTIRALSEGAGKGSTFSVTLPLSAEPVEMLAKKAIPMGLRDVDILLVEDDEPTRVMLAAALQTFGARVRAASSVADAISALDESWADVLVSDVALPGADGYSLIRHVRALGRPARLHAIALTAHARQQDRINLLDAGFDLYLSKPIEPQSLANAICELRAK